MKQAVLGIGYHLLLKSNFSHNAGYSVFPEFRVSPLGVKSSISAQNLMMWYKQRQCTSQKLFIVLQQLNTHHKLIVVKMNFDKPKICDIQTSFTYLHFLWILYCRYSNLILKRSLHLPQVSHRQV